MQTFKLTVNHPGHKIVSIKAIRAVTGFGLKEAKDFHEANEDRSGQVTAIIELPFADSQRHVVQKGCEALGYNVTLDDTQTTITRPGHYRVYWADSSRDNWTIEVFSVGGSLYYREGGDHQYLHSLSELSNQNSNDPWYRIRHVEPTDRDAFLASDNN